MSMQGKDALQKPSGRRRFGNKKEVPPAAAIRYLHSSETFANGKYVG